MSANAAALTNCLIRERHAVLRFLRRYLDPSSTEDAYQTLYMRLSSVPGEPPIGDAAGYLYRTAYHLVLEWARSTGRYQAMLAKFARMDGADESPDVAATVQAELELHRAVVAVSSLPQPTRGIFALHVHQGLSERDIAARVGMSRTTVSRHIRRAQDVVTRARDGH